MPLYYSTSSPNKDNKNSITRTATSFGIRDFLLLKNIQNPIRYPQLPTSVNGSPKGGQPVLDTMVNDGVIIQQQPLEVDGIFRYENAIIMNHYKNIDTPIPQLVEISDQTKQPIFPQSPNGVSDYAKEDIEKYGLLAKTEYKNYRKNLTLKNLYVDESKQIDSASFISLQPQQTAQQLTGYLDEYGNLNLGDNNLTQVADIAGSILNGQGLGLAKGGIVTNFDIRASLAGRVLTATGFMNDSKLGIIGGQQLVLALANNAAFNVQEQLLGKLNISDNLTSLLKTGKLAGLRPSYKISVNETLLGRALDTAARTLGFTVPKSQLDDDGSIFFTESGIVTNTIRASAMLNNTGKGQRVALGKQFEANLNGTSTHDRPSNSPFRSGYSLNFKKGPNGDFLVKGQKPNLYAFGTQDSQDSYNFLKPITQDDTIPEISYNRENLVRDFGFDDYSENSYNNGLYKVGAFATNFAWNSGNGDAVNKIEDSDEFNGTKKSLLRKTQLLFNSKGMKTMVSAKGESQYTDKSQIQTAVSPNGFISKGSGVMAGNKFNGDGSYNFGDNDTAESTFCRTWTPYYRYDKVGKLIRHRGLNQKNSDGSTLLPEYTDKAGSLRINTKGTVLDDNGFVKIAPYKTDKLGRDYADTKQYMFSIENLAWAGTPAVNLLECEQGPGDLLTGKFGRIMWFPPYDLTFSESSTVDFESSRFIGRGEPIYTYNNTERTGSLSFKIIIDHPNQLNAVAGNNTVQNEYINSFFAGCGDLSDEILRKLTIEERTMIENPPIITYEDMPEDPVPEIVTIDPVLPENFKIYFKNDCVDVKDTIDSNYEMSPKGSAGIGSYQSIPLEYRKNSRGVCVKQNEPYGTNTWPDNKSFGLNTKVIKINDKELTWTSPDFRNTLLAYLNDDIFANKAIVIKINAFASKQGCQQQNVILANLRAESIKKWLQEALDPAILKNNVKIKAIGNGESGVSIPDGANQDSETPKSQRFASITFEIDELNSNTPSTNTTTPKKQVQTTLRTVTEKIRRRFYTECDFFEKLTEDDPFVFDKIREKIRYFHPAFHSTTPEGFNSRLTFLLQCTRQGPTISEAGPKNLAFGPQPVCILRIGDFYNTKIIMDSVQFDYEPLVWDLNPEGVGVQPMIANVTISFKFIGGSSLLGPINKLQNALSFNYFANSQVYDARADYISKDESTKRQVFGTKNSNTAEQNNKNEEPVFNLTRVIDITKDNMNTIGMESTQLNKIERTIIDAKQENAAAVANSVQSLNTGSTSNPTPATATTVTISDESKIKIKLNGIPAYETSYAIVLFQVGRKDSNDASNLTQKYNLKATVFDDTKNINYEINISKEYFFDFYSEYSFTMADTSNGKNFTGFSTTNNYRLKIDFIGADNKGNFSKQVNITPAAANYE